MKLAVVDIGSNAIRCQISHVFTCHNAPVFKRIEYIRYPMKLGEEVFATGCISAAKETKFIKFLHALKLLMEVHEVEHSLICATSAMRMAKNAPAVIKRVYELLDLPIQVIDGIAEAEYINKVMHGLLDDKNYLHIDVGGGSTEFNVYARSGDTKVVLKKGTIRLDVPSAAQTNRSLLMHPGDLVQMDRAGKLAIQHGTPPEVVTAWQEHRFVFSQTSMAEITTLIKENYNLSVTLKNSQLADRTVSGTFQARTADEFLQVIAQLLEVNYNQQDNRVTFF